MPAHRKPWLSEDELAEIVEQEAAPVSANERWKRSKRALDDHVAEVGARVNDGQRYPVRTFTIAELPSDHWLAGRV